MIEKSRIGNHAKVRRGASPRPIGDPKYFGGAVGWVRISDVTSAKKYLSKTEQYVSPLGESLSVRVDCGDLIMSICATIGRPVIVDMPACIHDGFVQFYDVNNDNKEYMYYLLQFHEKDLERKGQPGTQVNLNTTIVENFEAFFPNSLAEQSKIARILSTIDTVIEKTEAAITKYKAIKAGMMGDLSTRGIDLVTGKLRPSYEEAPELYKPSELGRIPKEWEVGNLIDFASEQHYSFTGGPFGSDLQTKHYTVSGVRIIQLQNIGDGEFLDDYKIYTSEQKADALYSSNIFPGDIIISKMADPIARACIIPESNGRYLMASDGIRLKVNQTLFNTTFVLETINSKEFRRKAENRSTGSTRARIGLDDLRKIPVKYPSKTEQDQIAAILKSIDKNIAENEQLSKKNRQLKQALMSDLLTGKVRVKYEEEKTEAV